jgi:hypothetical protein
LVERRRKSSSLPLTLPLAQIITALWEVSKDISMKDAYPWENDSSGYYIYIYIYIYAHIFNMDICVKGSMWQDPSLV